VELYELELRVLERMVVDLADHHAERVDGRRVVARVAEAVAVTIALVRVGHARAVVARIACPVVVAVGLEGFARDGQLSTSSWTPSCPRPGCRRR